MPMFEYRCESCGETFEQLMRSSDRDEDLNCPSCGAKHPKKLLSSFSATMNGIGSGFEAAPSCATGNCPTGRCGLV